MNDNFDREVYLGAVATIRGSSKYPNIKGYVWFLELEDGVEVCAEIYGLPVYKPKTATTPQIGPHGFHIHEGTSCGDPGGNNPFSEAGPHYNPTNQPHGNHVSDLPVLIPSDGRAQMCFYTNKFTVDEIIGKTIVIHESPDDYTTQPSGNSGMKIACGKIIRAQDA